MAIRLVADEGPLVGRPVELVDGEHTLGTGGATLAVPDPLVDRSHARIVVAGGDARLRDEGSRHGTYLNGHRICDAPLMDGDLLQVGTTRFRVEADGPAHAAKSTVPCPSCGLSAAKPLPLLCPRCGHDLQAAADRVTAPAERRYCTRCGQSLPPGGRFCVACGHDSLGAGVPEGPPTSRAFMVPEPWKWMVETAVVTTIVMLLIGAIVVATMIDGYQTPAAMRRSMPALPTPTKAPEQVSAVPPSAASLDQSTDPGPWRQTGRVRLRYGGQPGELLDYVSRTRLSGTIEAMGQTLPLDADGSARYTQEILANDGQTLKLRLSMSPWAMQQNGAPFSGALPGAPPPLTITMTSTGEVVAVEQDGSGESTPLAGLPEGLAFDYRAITQQLSAASFPEQAVSVGDRWERSVPITLPHGGSLTFHNRSRLDGFETVNGRQCARVLTDVEAPLSLPLVDPGGASRSTGGLTGTVTSWFDPDAGEMVRSESDLGIDWTMAADDLPGIGEAAGLLGQIPGLEGMGEVDQQVKVGVNGRVQTTIEREQ